MTPEEERRRRLEEIRRAQGAPVQPTQSTIPDVPGESAEQRRLRESLRSQGINPNSYLSRGQAQREERKQTRLDSGVDADIARMRAGQTPTGEWADKLRENQDQLERTLQNIAMSDLSDDEKNRLIGLGTKRQDKFWLWGALEWFDRWSGDAAVRALFSQGEKLLDPDEDPSWDSFWNEWQNNVSWTEILAEYDLPNWLTRGGIDAVLNLFGEDLIPDGKNEGPGGLINQQSIAALGLDIVTSPTTFATGGSKAVAQFAGQGAQRLSRGLVQAARVANEAGDYAKTARAAQLATRASEVGFGGLSQAERRLATDLLRESGELTAKQTLQGGIYLRLPGREGLYVPGTRALAGATYRPAAMAINSLRTSRAGRTASKPFATVQRQILAAIKSGDQGKIGQSIEALAARSLAEAESAHWFVEGDQILNSLIRRAKKQKVDPEEISYFLEDANSANAMNLAARYQADPKVRELLDDIVDFQRRHWLERFNRMAGYEAIPELENYVPTIMASEFMEKIFGKTRGMGSEFSRAGFQQRTQFRVGEKYLGIDIVPANMHPRGLSPKQQGQEILRQYWGDDFVGPLYDRNWFKAAKSRQFVARYRLRGELTARYLKERGVAWTPQQAERIFGAPLTNMKSAMARYGLRKMTEPAMAARSQAVRAGAMTETAGTRIVQDMRALEEIVANGGSVKNLQPRVVETGQRIAGRDQSIRKLIGRRRQIAQRVERMERKLSTQVFRMTERMRKGGAATEAEQQAAATLSAWHMGFEPDDVAKLYDEWAEVDAEVGRYLAEVDLDADDLEKMQKPLTSLLTLQSDRLDVVNEALAMPRVDFSNENLMRLQALEAEKIQLEESLEVLLQIQRNTTDLNGSSRQLTRLRDGLDEEQAFNQARNKILEDPKLSAAQKRSRVRDLHKNAPITARHGLFSRAIDRLIEMAPDGVAKAPNNEPAMFVRRPMGMEAARARAGQVDLPRGALHGAPGRETSVDRLGLQFDFAIDVPAGSVDDAVDAARVNIKFKNPRMFIGVENPERVLDAEMFLNAVEAKLIDLSKLPKLRVAEKQFVEEVNAVIARHAGALDEGPDGVMRFVDDLDETLGRLADGDKPNPVAKLFVDRASERMAQSGGVAMDTTKMRRDLDALEGEVANKLDDLEGRYAQAAAQPAPTPAATPDVPASALPEQAAIDGDDQLMQLLDAPDEIRRATINLNDKVRHNVASMSMVGVSKSLSDKLDGAVGKFLDDATPLFRARRVNEEGGLTAWMDKMRSRLARDAEPNVKISSSELLDIERGSYSIPRVNKFRKRASDLRAALTTFDEAAAAGATPAKLASLARKALKDTDGIIKYNIPAKEFAAKFGNDLRGELVKGLQRSYEMLVSAKAYDEMLRFEFEMLERLKATRTAAVQQPKPTIRISNQIWSDYESRFGDELADRGGATVVKVNKNNTVVVEADRAVLDDFVEDLKLQIENIADNGYDAGNNLTQAYKRALGSIQKQLAKIDEAAPPATAAPSPAAAEVADAAPAGAFPDPQVARLETPYQEARTAREAAKVVEDELRQLDESEKALLDSLRDARTAKDTPIQRTSDDIAAGTAEAVDEFEAIFAASGSKAKLPRKLTAEHRLVVKGQLEPDDIEAVRSTYGELAPKYVYDLAERPGLAFGLEDESVPGRWWTDSFRLLSQEAVDPKTGFKIPPTPDGPIVLDDIFSDKTMKLIRGLPGFKESVATREEAKNLFAKLATSAWQSTVKDGRAAAGEIDGWIRALDANQPNFAGLLPKTVDGVEVKPSRLFYMDYGAETPALLLEGQGPDGPISVVLNADLYADIAPSVRIVVDPSRVERGPFTLAIGDRVVGVIMPVNPQGALDSLLAGQVEAASNVFSKRAGDYADSLLRSWTNYEAKLRTNPAKPPKRPSVSKEVAEQLRAAADKATSARQPLTNQEAVEALNAAEAAARAAGIDTTKPLTPGSRPRSDAAVELGKRWQQADLEAGRVEQRFRYAQNEVVRELMEDTPLKQRYEAYIEQQVQGQIDDAVERYFKVEQFIERAPKMNKTQVLGSLPGELTGIRQKKQAIAKAKEILPELRDRSNRLRTAEGRKALDAEMRMRFDEMYWLDWEISRVTPEGDEGIKDLMFQIRQRVEPQEAAQAAPVPTPPPAAAPTPPPAASPPPPPLDPNAVDAIQRFRSTGLIDTPDPELAAALQAIKQRIALADELRGGLNSVAVPRRSAAFGLIDELVNPAVRSMARADGEEYLARLGRDGAWLKKLKHKPEDVAESYKGFLKRKGYDGVLSDDASFRRVIVLDQSQVRPVDRASRLMLQLDELQAGIRTSIRDDQEKLVNLADKAFGFRIERQTMSKADAQATAADNLARLRELELSDLNRGEATLRTRAKRAFEQADEAELEGDNNLAMALRLEGQANAAEADQLAAGIGDDAGVLLSGKLAEVPGLAERIARFSGMSLKNLDANTVAEDWVVEMLTVGERLTIPGEVKGFLRVWDYLTNTLFKSYAIMTFGFHVRNLFGGVMNNWLGGVNVDSYRVFLRAEKSYFDTLRKTGNVDQALRAVDKSLGKEAGEAYRLWHQMEASSGMGIVGSFSEDVGRGVAVLSDEVNKGGVGRFGAFRASIQNDRLARERALNPLVGLQDNALVRSNAYLGQRVERFLRGSMAFDTFYKKGGDFTDAMLRVRKYHFDYQDLSNFERGFLRRVIPFYVWVSRNIPLQIEGLVTRPKVALTYWRVKQWLEQQSEEEAIVPYFYGREGAIRLPFTDANGNHMYWFPDMPLNDLGFFQNPIDFVTSALNPLIKMPLEIGPMQRKFFTGAPFTEELQEMPKHYGWVGITQALEAMGQVTKDKDGRPMADQRLIYALEQGWPMFARLQRWFPTDEAGKARAANTYLSNFLGVSIRTNDERSKSNQIRRVISQLDEELTKQRGLGSDVRIAGYREISDTTRTVELNMDRLRYETDYLLTAINTFDADQLEEIPGVGETVARWIVLSRQQNGEYTSLEDLMGLEQLSENKVNEILLSLADKPESMGLPAAKAIDINSGTADELEKIDGIGPTTAAKIIDFRTRFGPITSVWQLAEIDGVTRRQVEQIRAYYLDDEARRASEEYQRYLRMGGGRPIEEVVTP